MKTRFTVLDLKKWTAMTFLSLATCASMASSSPSIFYTSQAKADAALEAFDRSNPECLAWTNWQTTCSRLDREGVRTHCNKAVGRVEYSKVFCVANRARDLTGSAFGEKMETAAAFNRYCTAYRRVTGKKVCFDRSVDRPFGGLLISELRHPFCKTWGNKSGLYCSETDEGSKTPSCKAMESAGPASSPLMCFESNREARATTKCMRLRHANTDQTSIQPNAIEITNVFPGERPISPLAIAYCAEWSK
jgi:hypothetical protein